MKYYILKANLYKKIQIPIKNVCNHNINYEFLNTNDYKLRNGYIVDDIKVKELLNNKEGLLEFQKKNKELIREYFLYINEKNKQKFLKTIEFI